jgi:outer membrane protein
MQHAFSAPACRATVWLARAAALGAVAIWLALGSLARADPTRDRLYLRAGMLYLRPIPTSPDVVMSNLDGPAELALPNGPIAGSGVGAESNTMLAGIIGYRVYKNVAVEAVVASPFTMTLTLTGTLADTSVAPFALGNVPTGVPAFGSELGTTKVLPPILTAVYRFPLHARVRPYGGLGLSYVIPYDTKITNAVLTEVSQPSVDISADLAWVVQAGVDIQLWRQMYFTLDAKFVGGLDLVAEMNNLELTVPALPIYGTVSAGTGTAEVTVNPLVVQAGVGWNF